MAPKLPERANQPALDPYKVQTPLGQDLLKPAQVHPDGDYQNRRLPRGTSGNPERNVRNPFKK